MLKAIQYAGQAVVYVALMAVIGYFADSPAYTHFPPENALIKLVVAHGGQHEGGCREPTREELQKLAPNMRRKLICARNRLPITVELDIDGKAVYSALKEPTGLHNDGPSRVYARFPVSPGAHTVTVRLRDSDRAEGFDYEGTQEVTLEPKQLFIIQFRPEEGGFLFQ